MTPSAGLAWLNALPYGEAVAAHPIEEFGRRPGEHRETVSMTGGPEHER